MTLGGECRRWGGERRGQTADSTGRRTGTCGFWSGKGSTRRRCGWWTARTARSSTPAQSSGCRPRPASSAGRTASARPCDA
eukprot:782183-Rhodomonas_salina.2